MTTDWRPPMIWKPEFVAFAAENGRTPEEQDAHDRETSPKAPRAAFAAWLAKRDALTPSEVALAKVLAAWEPWTNDDGGVSPDAWGAMGYVHGALLDFDFIDGGSLTDKGRALLDRARKAGAL